MATPIVSFQDPLMMPPVMLGVTTPSIGLQDKGPAIDFGNGSNCPSSDPRLAMLNDSDCGSLTTLFWVKVVLILIGADV
jgi:hypothetical protein